MNDSRPPKVIDLVCFYAGGGRPRNRRPLASDAARGAAGLN